MKNTICASIHVDGVVGNLPAGVDITVERSSNPALEGESLVTLRQPEVMVMRKDMAIGYLNRMLYAILSA